MGTRVVGEGASVRGVDIRQGTGERGFRQYCRPEVLFRSRQYPDH